MPARGALAEASAPADRPERRATLVARSLVAALALALYTVAGVILAFLALAPAAFRRGPVGRRVTSIGRPRPDQRSQAARSAEQALPR